MIFRIQGNSMEPLLPEGRRVWTVRRRPQRGDILVVRGRDGRLVVHRLIERRGDLLILRGDNRPVEDRPFPRSALIGVVGAVEKSGEKWTRLPGWSGRALIFLTKIRPERLRRWLLHGLLGPVLRALAQPIARPVSDTRTVTKARRLNPSKRFEYQQLGDEVAVYDAATGAVHFLNQTASSVLRTIDAGGSLADIATELQRRYPDVPLDQIMRDVDRCVQQLRDADLIPNHSNGGQHGA
jgi:PqqD family protein of HPr-rel-A system